MLNGGLTARFGIANFGVSARANAKCEDFSTHEFVELKFRKKFTFQIFSGVLLKTLTLLIFMTLSSAVSAQTLNAQCMERIKAIHRDLPTSGATSAELIDINRRQKALFQGECASHPQASSYVSNADEAIATFQAQKDLQNSGGIGSRAGDMRNGKCPPGSNPIIGVYGPEVSCRRGVAQ